MKITKGKLIAIISAVVSVVLCLVIVLITVTSCDSDKGGGKTVKRVVKKKIIIVEEPDIDSGSDMTIYDVVDEEYDGPEEVVDTVVVPEYEVELKGESKTPMTDKIAFGFWTYDWGDWTEQFGDKYGKETDILTTASIGSIDEARYVKENGVSGWWMPNSTTSAFVSKDSTELSESWKRNILTTAEAYKLADVWDAIEGFHFDEPLGKLSGPQFRELTKFLAETFPDKRIFPVHCNLEITGNAGGRLIDTLSYEVSAYCTDVGYDNYNTPDINVYREWINKMKNMVGRKNVRIWLFPSAHLFNPQSDEDYLIDHLNMCYDLLKEQENPGGLFLYSWGTHGDSTGFSQLTDSKLNWRYDRFLNRVLEVSNEIRNTEYTYKIINN